jgi:pimeloyl-ACP methyl ester carboxylesterase
MSRALTEQGIATWNVEYRSLGDPGGGWPGTGDDVARAVEFVAELPIDHTRVVLVGHSAGGQLALWAAKRAQLPVVALAPVSDVQESAERNGPDSPPAKFMPAEHFAEGSPLELLPLGVPQIVIHGTADDGVPYAMSERYVAAAGGEAELVTLDSTGHFEPIDPLAPVFAQTVAAVRRLL